MAGNKVTRTKPLRGNPAFAMSAHRASRDVQAVDDRVGNSRTDHGCFLRRLLHAQNSRGLSLNAR